MVPGPAGPGDRVVRGGQRMQSAEHRTQPGEPAEAADGLHPTAFVDALNVTGYEHILLAEHRHRFGCGAALGGITLALQEAQDRGVPRGRPGPTGSR
jgi:hypothetical protein